MICNQSPYSSVKVKNSSKEVYKEIYMCFLYNTIKQWDGRKGPEKKYKKIQEERKHTY